MNNSMTPEGHHCMMLCKQISMRLGHNFISYEHLILAILDYNNPYINAVLKNAKVDKEELSEDIYEQIKELEKPTDIGGDLKDFVSFTTSLTRTLIYAGAEARKEGSGIITAYHLFLGVIDYCDEIGENIFTQLGYDFDVLKANIKDASGIMIVKDDKSMQLSNSQDFDDDDDDESEQSAVERFCINLTDKAIDGKLDEVIGRSSELQEMIEILSKRGKKNPILTGEPGVGKTAIVNALAQKIVNDQVPLNLIGMDVLQLDLTALVAGTIYRGQFEQRIKNVIDEVTQVDNVILFIDEIHTLIGAGNSEGALDASNILKPHLADGSIALIGATTIDEYSRHIQKDAALDRRFTSVLVNEPSITDTLEILNGIKYRYEKHHNVKYAKKTINSIVELSNKYITNRNFPDKAIDVMD